MGVLWRSDAPLEPTVGDIDLLKGSGITTFIDLRTDREVTQRPTALSCTNGFDYHHLPIDEGSVPPDSFDKVPLSYMKIAVANNMPEVWEIIASAEGGAMFFCTAGKDRTGVVSAILLLACGVDREIVAKDYALSRKYNRLRLEQYLAEHPDTDRSIVMAREETMEKFIDLFFGYYGSCLRYFENMGLVKEYEKIKHRLTIGLTEVQ